MRIQIKTMVAAFGALLFAAAPAVANAERVFFLVGTRHIYRIGAFQYAHVDERQKIEQDYADQVAADRDIFNKAINDGANAADESANLNAALDDLAAERDKELGALYENADYERVRHPELQIQGDGPYQVMAIDFHWRADVEVFDDFYVYAPWPGYVVVDHPYGWAYGVLYSPFEFHHVYLGWYGGYVALGSPPFVGIYGHAGPVVFAIGGGFPFARHYGVVSPGFEHSAYFRGHGPLASRGGFQSHSQVTGGGSRYGNPDHAQPGVSKYSRGHNAPPGGDRAPVGGSRYNHGQSSSASGANGAGSSTSRYNRGTSGSSDKASGSSHLGNGHANTGPKKDSGHNASAGKGSGSSGKKGDEHGR